jgi:transcriptional regulator with GAF, ATPase, and Fis domain
VSDTVSAILSTARRPRARAALHVGLAGDAPFAKPARFGLGGLDRVEIGRSDRRSFTRSYERGAETGMLALADTRLSSRHARLSRVGSTWVVEDLESKNGTWLGKQRILRKPLSDGDVMLVGHTAIVFRDTGGEADDLDDFPSAPAPGLATLSSTLAERFAELTAAAKSRVPIHISGETGTGKELAARAAHALSQRPGRFVPVNCGALPGSLLEGELFGHRKGAYTGAGEDRVGLIRSADGGTLFLDEIGELPAPSQAALLRVLQEGEVLPLGADRALKVDLRIVTATHRDLDAEVAANRFRADLRARLLGVSLELPALRSRLEDLALLVREFLLRLDARPDVTFSADAVAALYAHDWPLNIRELERTIGAALAIARGRIELHHLPHALREPVTPEPPSDMQLSPPERELRTTLIELIDRHDGNLAAVARELGKDRTQIRRWLKRFGIARK